VPPSAFTKIAKRNRVVSTALSVLLHGTYFEVSGDPPPSVCNRPLVRRAFNIWWPAISPRFTRQVVCHSC